MKLEAVYDGDNRISVPVEVYKELLVVYVENGTNKKLVEDAKDSLEFIGSLGM